MKNLFTKRPAAELPATAETVSDATVSARTKVERLAAMELRHFSRFRELERKAAEVRSIIGQQIVTAELEGRPVPDVEGRLAALAPAREAAWVAMNAARDQRRAGILDFQRARAGEVRARATELRTQAQKRKLTTDDLLRRLAEHEGVEYLPHSTLASFQIAVGVLPHDDSDQQWRREGIRFPQTDGMLAEADRLGIQADEVERTGVRDWGAVRADGIDNLFIAVLQDPSSLGPPLPEILAWGEKAETEMRQRNPGAAGAGFVLVWRQERLQFERSTCEPVLTRG